MLHAEWTLLNDPAASAGTGRSVPQPEDCGAGPVHQPGRTGQPAAAVSVPEPAPLGSVWRRRWPSRPPPVAVVPPAAPAKPAVVAAAPTPPARSRAQAAPAAPGGRGSSAGAAAIARYFARPLRLTCRGRRCRRSSMHPLPTQSPPDRLSVPPSAWRHAAGRRRRRQPMPVSASQWVTNGGGG